MKIWIAALGWFDDGDEEFITVPRESFTSEQLERNLRDYWAWNIRDNEGFQADGPTVFISWG